MWIWTLSAHIFKGYPKAKAYQDFRKMLDNEKEIDAIVNWNARSYARPYSILCHKNGETCLC